jgi:hypothetical protein
MSQSRQLTRVGEVGSVQDEGRRGGLRCRLQDVAECGGAVVAQTPAHGQPKANITFIHTAHTAPLVHAKPYWMRGKLRQRLPQLRVGFD